MFLQSLFFTVFALLLTTLFAISALTNVHRLSISHAQRSMLAAADGAVERTREAADSTMQRIALQQNVLPLLTEIPDTTDSSGTVTVHTTIDGALYAMSSPEGTQQACVVHDAQHQCNLSIGPDLAEQRVWETIDLRTLAASGEQITLRRHVLLRLLRTKPYATVVAVRDDGVSGSALLGDPSGVTAAANDASSPSIDAAAQFHDTRVHIYEPCRFVTSNNPAIATDNRVWANWQGGQTTPGRQNSCDNGAGETTRYVNTTQSSPARAASVWGH